MRTGRLRHRIEFQVSVDDGDESGAIIKDWKFYKKLWSEFLPSSDSQSKESESSGAEVTSDRFTVTIRYREDISPSMRIIFGGQPYRIISSPVDPFGRKDRLTFECTLDV